MLGDVLWNAKQHPKLQQPLAEVEREFFHDAVIAPLPLSIRADLTRQYETQDNLEDRTGRFFRASEIVGYVIRAVQQYRSGVRLLGQRVFVNQYADICRWADEFQSVRVIFAPFREEVENALANDPVCVRFAEETGKSACIRELLANVQGQRGDGAAVTVR